MKCAKCNAVLRENDELKWECNSCHQMCKANLAMLTQIQAQRNNGYTGTMVSCPFCGGVLDDGNETIHWDCMYCGERRTGNIKIFLKPDVMAQPEPEKAAEPAQESAEASGIEWEDGEKPEEVIDPREERRIRREREREEREQRELQKNEEEKNRFLAEASVQTLGEEIPDSLFADIPFRGKPKSVPGTNAGSAGAAPTGATTAPAGMATPPTSSPGTASTSAAAPASPTPTSASTPPKVPASPAPTSAATSPKVPASPAPTSAATSPKAPTAPSSEAASTSASTPPKAQASPAPTSAATSSTPPRRPLGPKTASGPIPPSSTAFEPSSSATAPTGPDTDKALENVAFEREREPEKKQIWPKVITAIITLLLVAAVGAGAFVAVQYFLSPTRQFRSAIQKADYTAAEDIYNSKIKGDQEEERVAEIAVEHFLNDAFQIYKSGGSSDAYYKLKDFAESILNMNTANYELAVATTPPDELDSSLAASAEPTADASANPDASVSPDVSVSPDASANPDVSASPAASVEPSASATPAVTEAAAASATPEATPAATEEPGQSGTAPGMSGEDDISAVLAQAKKYTHQKKYEQAYNYLAPYKKSDTSGQVKKEMAAVKKKWESATIKEFKALCAKLTIVYAAAEKRYHIVPRGYYTNYNQISRSNNVGGIAYMNSAKKKVSVTKIGKKGALTAIGKTNRANLMKFKEMIEKYPYLAKEI